MSRKDLERIARELRDTRESMPTGGTERERQAWMNGWRESVEAVADACHDLMGLNGNGNRRFNRERFLTAAGAI